MSEINYKYISLFGERWCVRIRLQDTRLNKSFSFSCHGGVDSALQLAITWRDNMLKRLKLENALKVERRQTIFGRAKDINPIIGVHLSIGKSLSGKEVISWAARGPDIKRFFSIAKYGEKEAFHRACKVRYTYDGCLIIINKKALPYRPIYPYRHQKSIHL